MVGSSNAVVTGVVAAACTVQEGDLMDLSCPRVGRTKVQAGREIELSAGMHQEGYPD